MKIIPFRNWIVMGLKEIDFLKWCGLVKASKNCLSDVHVETTGSSELCVITKSNSVKNVLKTNTKDVYDLLIMKSHGDIVNTPRICRIVDDEVNWAHIFKRLHMMSIDTKAREFQFKFVNDIIATNYWLCKWKIKDSDKCTFCNVQPELLEHLFWECRYVQELWRLIGNWYESKTQCVIDLSHDKVLLGCDDELLYAIILTAKQTIYSSKLAETKPSLNSFVYRFEGLRQLEMYIVTNSKNSGTVERLVEKWAPLEH